MKKQKTIQRKLVKAKRKPFFKLRGKIGASVLLGVGVAATLGAFLISTPEFTKYEQPPQQVNACLDFDPPNQSEAVQFGSTYYDLIKKGAGVVDSKIGEMEKVGQLDDGSAEVYKMPRVNIFGDLVKISTIYVLRDKKSGYHNFDIYLKRGEQIPDEIRNSKSIGANGPMQVVVDDNTKFPPEGFDVDQIKNSTKVMDPNYPSYVYGNFKNTAEYVNSLKGVESVGTLATPKGELQVFYHNASAYLIDGNDSYEYAPSSTRIGFTPYIEGGDGFPNLQLRKFTLKSSSVNPTCWYTPECKPAVYLYPESKMSVNVKVDPKGYLTYTKPSYPVGTGWNVTANPDGTIETDKSLFDYLYYESNLITSEIKEPKEGFVVAYDKLPEFYESLLPKLGLSGQEINDFVEYWRPILPQAPYYFVGLLERKNIDDLERMVITPKPDNVLRVRVYFEALKEKKEVKEPEIKIVSRPKNGFTVVEWGGVVKSDPNSPFTCSQ